MILDQNTRYLLILYRYKETRPNPSQKPADFECLRTRFVEEINQLQLRMQNRFFVSGEALLDPRIIIPLPPPVQDDDDDDDDDLPELLSPSILAPPPPPPQPVTASAAAAPETATTSNNTTRAIFPPSLPIDNSRAAIVKDPKFSYESYKISVCLPEEETMLKLIFFRLFRYFYIRLFFNSEYKEFEDPDMRFHRHNLMAGLVADHTRLTYRKIRSAHMVFILRKVMIVFRVYSKYSTNFDREALKSDVRDLINRGVQMEEERWYEPVNDGYELRERTCRCTECRTPGRRYSKCIPRVGSGRNVIDSYMSSALADMIIKCYTPTVLGKMDAEKIFYSAHELINCFGESKHFIFDECQVLPPYGLIELIDKKIMDNINFFVAF